VNLRTLVGRWKIRRRENPREIVAEGPFRHRLDGDVLVETRGDLTTVRFDGRVLLLKRAADWRAACAQHDAIVNRIHNYVHWRVFEPIYRHEWERFVADL
jgi:hypothetical protein